MGSASEVVLLGPELSRQFSITLSVPVPVVQALNGEQLEMVTKVSAAVVYAID